MPTKRAVARGILGHGPPGIFFNFNSEIDSQCCFLGHFSIMARQV